MRTPLLLLLLLLLLAAGGAHAHRYIPGFLLNSASTPTRACSSSTSTSSTGHHHRTHTAGFTLPSLPWAAAPCKQARRAPTTTLLPPSPSASTSALLTRVCGGASSATTTTTNDPSSIIHRATAALTAATTPESLAALAAGPVGVGLGTNTALALLGIAVKQHWLTQSGLLHAWVLGVALWSTLGWTGWLVCVLYLVFGSLVTKVKQREKEARGIAEKRGGARGPENVWGSAAAGTMCALGALFAPALAPLMKIGYVASLATKLSDTFASEIGKAYGKRTFLITNLKPVPPGTEGAVSLEGTLAGVVGSILMGAAGVALGLVSAASLPLILAAAFVATNVESLLGVWLQNDKYPWATNEFINFLNTLIGAAFAMGVTVAVGGK